MSQTTNTVDDEDANAASVVSPHPSRHGKEEEEEFVQVGNDAAFANALHRHRQSPGYSHMHPLLERQGSLSDGEDYFAHTRPSHRRSPRGREGAPIARRRETLGAPPRHVSVHRPSLGIDTSQSRRYGSHPAQWTNPTSSTLAMSPPPFARRSGDHRRMSLSPMGRRVVAGITVPPASMYLSRITSQEPTVEHRGVSRGSDPLYEMEDPVERLTIAERTQGEVFTTVEAMLEEHERSFRSEGRSVASQSRLEEKEEEEEESERWPSAVLEVSNEAESAVRIRTPPRTPSPVNMMRVGGDISLIENESPPFTPGSIRVRKSDGSEEEWVEDVKGRDFEREDVFSPNPTGLLREESTPEDEDEPSGPMSVDSEGEDDDGFGREASSIISDVVPLEAPVVRHDRSLNDGRRALGLSLPNLPQDESEEEEDEPSFVEILREQDLIIPSRRQITEPTHFTHVTPTPKKRVSTQVPLSKSEPGLDPVKEVLKLMPQDIVDQVLAQTGASIESLQALKSRTDATVNGETLLERELVVILAGEPFQTRVQEKIHAGFIRAMNYERIQRGESEYVAVVNPMSLNKVELKKRDDGCVVRFVRWQEDVRFSAQIKDVSDAALCIYNFTSDSDQVDIERASAIGTMFPLYPVYQESSPAKGLALRRRIHAGLVQCGVDPGNFVFLPGIEPAIFQLSIMDPRLLRNYLLSAKKRVLAEAHAVEQRKQFRKRIEWSITAVLLFLIFILMAFPVEDMSVGEWKSLLTLKPPWRYYHRSWRWRSQSRTEFDEDVEDIEREFVLQPEPIIISEETAYDTPRERIWDRLNGLGGRIAERTSDLLKYQLGKDASNSKKKWLKPLLIGSLPTTIAGLLEDGQGGASARPAWFQSGSALAIAVESALDVVMDVSEKAAEMALLTLLGMYVVADEAKLLAEAAWLEFEESQVGQEMLAVKDWMKDRGKLVFELAKKRWKRLRQSMSKGSS